MLRSPLLVLPLALLVASWTPASAGQPASANEHKGKSMRVLLIGNSYAAGIRQPLLKLFEADAARSIELKVFSPGGRRLIQHLHRPAVVKAIQNGTWDAVIIQEQSQMPSVTWLNYMRAREAAAKAGQPIPNAVDWLDAQIAGREVDPKDRSFGAAHVGVWAGAVGLTEVAANADVKRIIMLSAWPRHPGEYKKARPYLGMFRQLGASDGVSAARAMLDCNNGVARAWRERAAEFKGSFDQPPAVAWVGEAVLEAALQTDGTMYAGDHYHASRDGSYTAAAVLYRMLTARPSASLLPWPEVDKALAPSLAAIADATEGPGS